MTSQIMVVVMTRDRWPDLQASLPRHEAPVILVDNGSTDGTPDLVRRHFPAVDVVELSGNVGSVARHIGVERARTPYVAFADDDSWWAPEALAEAVRVRRDAYLAAGGFDEVVFFMGEEERLSLDLATLGWGLAYVDHVVAHHPPFPGAGLGRATGPRRGARAAGARDLSL